MPGYYLNLTDFEKDELRALLLRLVQEDIAHEAACSISTPKEES